MKSNVGHIHTCVGALWTHNHLLPPPIHSTHVNTQQVAFDDSKWRVLNLPHDFIVEGTFTPDADKAHGYLPFGKAWYRQTFSLPIEWQNQRVWIDFDGIQRNSTVFVNGHKVTFHSSGYTPFRFVLDTSAEGGLVHLGPDEINTLVVHVDATPTDGWWYDGGGIYRSVYITVTDLLHIIPWGIYLPSAVKEGSIRRLDVNDADAHTASLNKQGRLIGDAVLTIQVAVESERKGDTSFLARSTITGPEGNNNQAVVSERQTLESGTNTVIVLEIDMPGCYLWSVDHPALYYVKTELIMLVGGEDDAQAQVVDVVEETTGIRNIHFDANTGFALNGEIMKVGMKLAGNVVGLLYLLTAILTHVFYSLPHI